MAERQEQTPYLNLTQRLFLRLLYPGSEVMVLMANSLNNKGLDFQWREAAGAARSAWLRPPRSLP
jgi:hypothetical protein